MSNKQNITIAELSSAGTAPANPPPPPAGSVQLRPVVARHNKARSLGTHNSRSPKKRASPAHQCGGGKNNGY